MRHLRLAFLVLIVPTLALGCAGPGSPWLFDPGGRGAARLIREGMTYQDVNKIRMEHFGDARALVELYYNPKAPGSLEVAQAGCSGVVYYPVATNRCQRVAYADGRVVEVAIVAYRGDFWNTPRAARPALR